MLQKDEQTLVQRKLLLKIKMIIKIVLRKLLHVVKFFGRRKVFLMLPMVVSIVVFWPIFWWFAVETSKVLMPSLPYKLSLEHFRRNRSLQHYLTNIQVLIEPWIPPCKQFEEVPVIIMVTSAPHRSYQRYALRETWAKYQPTYFVLGVYGDQTDRTLEDNREEANRFGDLIVFDFRDHYENLTLKTALMMKWTLEQCPQTNFMFKTDDDVLVNPWMLSKVLLENSKAHLVGYNFYNNLYRDKNNKWYMPRWLLHDDGKLNYISGTAYLIKGDKIQKILQKAYQVPLVNLEDVYFTYLVAYKGLGLTLTHDRRLNPYKPWLRLSCVYWGLASIHSLKPNDLISVWYKIRTLVDDHDDRQSICENYEFYYMFNDMIMY